MSEEILKLRYTEYEKRRKEKCKIVDKSKQMLDNRKINEFKDEKILKKEKDDYKLFKEEKKFELHEFIEK